MRVSLTVKVGGFNRAPVRVEVAWEGGSWRACVATRCDAGWIFLRRPAPAYIVARCQRLFNGCPRPSPVWRPV